MKTTRILGAIIAFTVAAVPALGISNNVTKTIPTIQMTAEAGWVQSGSRWWYQNPDGSYPKNQWFKNEGKWYHFDSEGWMQTGWIQDCGKKYYLYQHTGVMVTGCAPTGTNTWGNFNLSGALIESSGAPYLTYYDLVIRTSPSKKAASIGKCVRKEDLVLVTAHSYGSNGETWGKVNYMGMFQGWICLNDKSSLYTTGRPAALYEVADRKFK